MTSDQTTLIAILAAILALLVWGRWRYDLIAIVGLIVATVLGVVEAKQAFSGFGHPATVIIALVLIVSRGLSNAGVIDQVARVVTRLGTTMTRHIFYMSGIAAALSAVMNNVAALALLMPVDLQAAKKAKRAAALTLMPLSFASILGGMVTLIGTPPNIIIAAFREETKAGEPFSMFDFAPVGGVVAVVGVLFVTLIGWRLIPVQKKSASGGETFDLEDYIAEAKVPKDSNLIGRTIHQLDETSRTHEIDLVGLVRRGKRQPGLARHIEIKAGDLLVIEGGPQDIEAFIGDQGLTHAVAEGAKASLLTGEDASIMEVVVPPGARTVGRTAMDFRLKYRFGVHLIGVARKGKRFRERLRHLPLEPGDVLLLQGNTGELPEAIQWMGCLPLGVRSLPVVQRGRALLAGAIFASAIALAATSVLDLSIALAATAVVMVGLKIVPLREIYAQVEWPVIVLIAAMIPIGSAMQTTHATDLIAKGIVDLGSGLPAWGVLVILMIVTMTLSDVMNNTATAVVVGPIAVDVADQLTKNSDPFLMAVAVAASCAFLTPIGHKNNTLILGPGGYRFGDYWRMGLPLEIIVIAVSVPMILWVWPL